MNEAVAKVIDFNSRASVEHVYYWTAVVPKLSRTDS